MSPRVPAAAPILLLLPVLPSAQQAFPGPLLEGPIWTVEGTRTAEALGSAVARAGDVDGDGFEDLLVGAYLADGAFADEGRVELYRGGPGGLSPLPARTFTGGQASAWLGYSIACARDVNGDGFDDVIVGAPLFDVRVNAKIAQLGMPPSPPIVLAGAGRAIASYGSTSGLSTTPGWAARGSGAGALFGTSVASAGDVNADGFDDVIVGAPSGKGYVELYLGSSQGLRAKPAWHADGDQVNAFFGAAVSSAGDVNGDGYDDVLVGAYGYDDVAEDTGKAWLFRGGPQGPEPTASWTYVFPSFGQPAGQALGKALGSAGDLDRDGFDDVLIGAPNLLQFFGGPGTVLFFRGSSSGLELAPSWSATRSNQHFGESVSAGDIDGDGHAEVIVGSPIFDEFLQATPNGILENVEAGRVEVWKGSPSGPGVAPFWVENGSEAGANFGQASAFAGDVDGDGLGDLLVGAPGEDGIAVDSGSARLYSGELDACLPLAPSWAFAGQAGDRIGTLLASAGDVNGDGFDDLLDSSPQALGWHGGAVVWHGSPLGLADAPSWFTTNSSATYGYGYACDGAGDVNGNGFDDVALVDLNDPGFVFVGRVLVFSGSSSGLSTSPAWTLAGTANAMASDVGRLGDLDGDGSADLLGDVYTGQASQAWIFRGSSTGPATANRWTLPSIQYGSRGIGDVNGDGFVDLAVEKNGPPRTDVYSGSISGPVLSSISFSVNNNTYYPSVYGLGDLDGDGFDDISVAADDLGQPEHLVVLGSSSGPVGTPDPVLQRYAKSFDPAVGARDVNGDGFDEVLVVESVALPQPNASEAIVLLFRGGASGLERHPCWRLEVGAQLPSPIATPFHAVSSAGDVNGDGYDDVAIGIPTPNGAGLILVFHGGP